MKGTQTLNIIQYNVNRSKNIVQHHFLQALDPLKHHVVALQEPWFHPTEKTTIKHTAYHLVFPDVHKIRTCIYVSKHLEVGKWRKEETPKEAGGDIISISIHSNRSKIYVNNVYNPHPLSHGSKDLGTIKFLPEIISKGQHILVGDFDLHLPRW